MEPASPVRYAGFWIRLKAWGIDGLITQIIQWTGMALLGTVAHAQAVIDPNIQKLVDMGWLSPGTDPASINALLQANGASGSGSLIDPSDIVIYIMISAIYTIWFTAGKWQATPGKRWCKIKVVMAANGQALTLRQSALRHAASGMSWLPFALGYIMAGFYKEKTAMHDAMIGTRVIHR